MNILTIKEIRNLNTKEKNEKILEIHHALFELKFKQATKQSIKTHLLKKYRRMLAQLLTIQNH